MMRVILTLSGPVMLNNFIQTLYNLADTYFVSLLGTLEVAAVSFIWPVIFLMMAFGIGLNVAGTSLISQHIGSGDQETARKTAGALLSFSLLLSVVLGFLGYLVSPLILRAMGAGELYDHAYTFLSILFIGMPTMYVMFAYNAIKTGLGDTMRPMIIGGLSVVSNIILDPLFMFTLGMGLKGAAYATVLARGVFGIYAISTLFAPGQSFRLRLDDLKLRKDMLTDLIRIGAPASIGQSTSSVGFIVMNAFIKSFGVTTLAAFAIGNRISSLVMMPAMGVGAALATIVGQNLGAGNPDRAKQAVRFSSILTTAIFVLGGAVIMYFAKQVVGVFTVDPEVLAQGAYYLVLITASLPVFGIFQILVGTFQGSGHTTSAMIMQFGRLWGLRIPMILILKQFSHLGSNAVWYAMVMSNVIITLIGYGIYRTGKWQEKTIREEEQPAMETSSSKAD